MVELLYLPFFCLETAKHSFLFSSDADLQSSPKYLVHMIRQWKLDKALPIKVAGTSLDSCSSNSTFFMIHLCLGDFHQCGMMLAKQMPNELFTFDSNELQVLERQQMSSKDATCLKFKNFTK